MESIPKSDNSPLAQSPTPLTPSLTSATRGPRLDWFDRTRNLKLIEFVTHALLSKSTGTNKGHLSKHDWISITKSFNAYFGLSVDKKCLSNRLSNLKKDFQSFESIKNASFESEDPRLDEAVWKDFMEKDPNSAKFSKKDFEYYQEMKEMFAMKPANGIVCLELNDFLGKHELEESKNEVLESQIETPEPKKIKETLELPKLLVGVEDSEKVLNPSTPWIDCRNGSSNRDYCDLAVDHLDAFHLTDDQIIQAVEFLMSPIKARTFLKLKAERLQLLMLQKQAFKKS